MSNRDDAITGTTDVYLTLANDELRRCDATSPPPATKSPTGSPFRLLCRRAGRVRARVEAFRSKRKTLIRRCLYLVLVVLYASYFGCAVRHQFGDEPSIRLLWVTAVVVAGFVWVRLRDVFVERASQSSSRLASFVGTLKKHASLINWSVQRKFLRLESRTVSERVISHCVGDVRDSNQE